MMLKDKVALVTGAGRGIGRAIALGLAKEGARLVLSDIEGGPSLSDLSSRIRNMGREALHIQGDVALEEDVNRMVKAALEAFGGIDILVNNAGLRTVVMRGVDYYPVVDMDVGDWDRMVAVNLRGPFMLSRAALPHMIIQRRGSIINISSNAGHRAVPGKSAYTASKHGLEGFTRALAGEVKEFNIRVNALAPGGKVDVDGRGGLPVGSIVPACIYLASDASREITGESVIAAKWNEERRIG